MHPPAAPSQPRSQSTLAGPRLLRQVAVKMLCKQGCQHPTARPPADGTTCQEDASMAGHFLPNNSHTAQLADAARKAHKANDKPTFAMVDGRACNKQEFAPRLARKERATRQREYGCNLGRPRYHIADIATFRNVSYRIVRAIGPASVSYRIVSCYPCDRRVSIVWYRIVSVVGVAISWRCS